MTSSARRVLYVGGMHTTPEEAGLRALSLVEDLPDKERALALELLQALHRRAVLHLPVIRRHAMKLTRQSH